MSTYSSTVSDKKGPLAQTQEASEQPLASAWLEWQCQMVSGAIRGAVYSLGKIELSEANALWPADGLAEPLLVAAATQAEKNNASVQFSKIAYGPNNQRLCDVIACPILTDGVATAFVALAFSVRSEPQQQAVLQLIRWGGLWLDTLSERQQKSNAHQHEYALALSSSVASQPNVLTAAIEAVNKLAKGTACDRVSIGFRKELKTRLKAISNTPKIERRSPLVRRIETAMEESSDQQAVVVFPSTEHSTLIDNAHATLSKGDGHQFLLTVPLFKADQAIGSLTFERDGELPFDQATVKFLCSIARLLSATFVHKIQLERPLISKLASGCYSAATVLFGKNILS